MQYNGMQIVNFFLLSRMLFKRKNTKNCFRFIDFNKRQFLLSSVLYRRPQLSVGSLEGCRT